MKKIIVAILVGLCVMGSYGIASAYVLGPTTTVLTPVAQNVPTGTVVASILGSSFTGKDVALNTVFSGTYSHWVLKDNTTGNLSFLYQFVNGATAPTALISRLSTTGFSGWTTSGGYDMDPLTDLGFGAVATADTAPFFLDRNDGTIGLTWIDLPGTYAKVHPGDTAPMLWIQTDAKFYTAASSSIIDGGTADIFTYGPAIPEPSSMLLLGMGIFGMLGLRKKKA